MMRMLTRFVIAAAVCAAAQPVFAACTVDTPTHKECLVGVVPLMPRTTIPTNGLIKFDAATGHFTAVGIPMYTDFPPRVAITPSMVPTAPGRQMAISIYVDENGNASGDPSGPDFKLTGTMIVEGQKYTGILLEGEILDFGYAERGAKDAFDFVFEVTGGTMASFYNGQVGVTLQTYGTLQPPFTGSFKTSFQACFCGVFGPVTRCDDVIGDYAWCDENGNGIQDETLDLGIEGVRVLLYKKSACTFNPVTSGYDCVGAPFAEECTNVNGKYLFNHLQCTADEYVVKIGDPCSGSPLTPTLDGVGGDRTKDSDNAAGTLVSPLDLSYDFGFLPSLMPAVVGHVWDDTNANGSEDAGETGISGVTVTLLRDDGQQRVQPTNPLGNFRFDNVEPGRYRICVPRNLPGHRPLENNCTDWFDVVLGCKSIGLNFLFPYQPIPCIGDRVWNDLDGSGGPDDLSEPGLNDWLVTLWGPNHLFRSALTGTNTDQGVTGYYLFSNLTPGQYRVCVQAPSGWVETYDLDGINQPPLYHNCAIVTLGEGECNLDVDFSFRQIIDPGDRVWNDVNGNGQQDSGENGINGATVTLADRSGKIIGTQTTSGDGNYRFASVPSGWYTVCVTVPSNYSPTYDIDGIATPNCATVLVTSERDDVDFGYRMAAKIGDRVWEDKNGNGTAESTEPGMAGIEVTATSRSTQKVFTAVTDANGKYMIMDLDAGTYNVCVQAPAGYRTTRPSTGCTLVTLATGMSKLTVDFGLKANQ